MLTTNEPQNEPRVYAPRTDKKPSGKQIYRICRDL
jgi:hypothetical protein